MKKWSKVLKLILRERKINVSWASSFTELLNETSQTSCATPKKNVGFVGSDSERISYQH